MHDFEVGLRVPMRVSYAKRSSSPLSNFLFIKGVGVSKAKKSPWQFFPEILVMCSGT